MVSSLIARTFIEFNECNLRLVHTCRKAYFPLGEFVRANKQKSRNSRDEFFRHAANFNQSRLPDSCFRFTSREQSRQVENRIAGRCD